MLIFFWFQPASSTGGGIWWYNGNPRFAMQKNVAGQKLVILAIDTATNSPKTGDAANLTAYVSKDDGSVTVLGDTSASEMDATNAQGLYSFDLTQGETNANKLVFSGKSSTSGVKLVPQIVFTVPPNFQATSITSAGAVSATESDVLQSTTIATLASQIEFTLTAGSADDKAYDGCIVVVTDASTSTQKATAPVLSYTGSTKTVRLAFDPGVFTMAAGDSIAVIAANERPVVHVEMSVKSTAGTTAQLAVWMEVAGKILPVASIDASASCSVVVREHDAGVNLFTAAGAAADITNSVFQYEQASPGFTDDRQYIVTATVTLNGVAFSSTHNRVVIG